MVALLVVLTILVFLTLDFFVQRRELASSAAPALHLPGENPPAGVLIDAAHNWVARQPWGGVLVGTDGLPATLLGGPGSIEPPAEGRRVRRGEPVVTLRHGKRDVTLGAPIDGVVLSRNEEALAEPGCLRSDPYGRGWLYLLWPQEPGMDLYGMRDGRGAVDWMRRELRRLRDLLVALPHPSPLAAGTLPDGGPPLEGVAGLLDEESWRRVAREMFSAADRDAGRPGPGTDPGDRPAN